MKFDRRRGLLLVAASLPLWVACSAPLTVEVYNNTGESFVVFYEPKSFAVAPSSMGSVTIRPTDQSLLRVKSDSFERSYQVNFSALGGECWVPGLRYTVKIQVNDLGEVLVLSKEQEFVVDEGGCDRYGILREQ